MNSLRIFFRILLLFSLLTAGCAGLDMKTGPVSFETPAAILKLRDLEPNPQEELGILLRVPMPKAGEIHAENHLKIYSRLRGDQGLGLDLSQEILMTFKPVAGKDSYLQRTVTSFDKGAGKITEEVELSPRGEVIRFLEGRHESQAGKFQVLNLSRTPVYPEAAVKRGDRWTYEEKMDARVESFWVKEKNPEPYLMKAQSTLTGFSEVLGRRCVVIKTVSTQNKKVNLKVLFKQVTGEVTTELEKTQYFDYQRGLLRAEVTQTRSHSVFPDLKIEERGVSQSIYRILD